MGKSKVSIHDLARKALEEFGSPVSASETLVSLRDARRMAVATMEAWAPIAARWITSEEPGTTVKAFADLTGGNSNTLYRVSFAGDLMRASRKVGHAIRWEDAATVANYHGATRSAREAILSAIEAGSNPLEARAGEAHVVKFAKGDLAAMRGETSPTDAPETTDTPAGEDVTPTDATGVLTGTAGDDTASWVRVLDRMARGVTTLNGDVLKAVLTAAQTLADECAAELEVRGLKVA